MKYVTSLASGKSFAVSKNPVANLETEVREQHAGETNKDNKSDKAERRTESFAAVSTENA